MIVSRRGGLYLEKKDFVVRFAGEGGQGVVTSAEGLAQASAQVGYHSQTFATFPSQILGGPTWTQTRVSTTRVLSSGDELDVLVAFNEEAYESHKGDVGETGVIIYNTGEFELESDGKSFGMPFDDLAKSTGNSRAANMVVIGALAYLVNMTQSIIKALTLGRQEAEKSGFSLGALAPPYKPDYEQIMVNGNVAIGLGALSAGLDVYIGYPISPATSLLVWMERNLSGPGKLAYQASSEIESITSIIGAGYAGKKSMTGTAGPGFSLMSEGLGLAWMSEIPCVITNVQRGGPSTGLPTKTEQSDLLTAMFPGHGDVKLPVIAPGTVEECFNAGIAAINWAERYQGPVVLLSEMALSERQQNIPKPDLSKINPEIRKIYSGQNGYQRYEGWELSPMPIPGTPGSYVANGSEHDGMGDTTHLPERHVQMTNRRFSKLKLLENEFFESVNPEFNLCLMPWGGSKGPAMVAYENLIESVEIISWLYTMFLNPLPAELLQLLKSKELVLVPELNYMGQFSSILRTYGVKAESITQFTGLPFKVRDLCARVAGRVKQHQQERIPT